MKYKFKPSGVCATLMEAEIENDVIKSFKTTGGCHGNSQGICALIKGQRVDDVIKTLKGIDCRGKGTSCPDQIAIFLQKIKNKKI